MISGVLDKLGMVQQEFSLAECLAGLHNDRCQVNGKVRKLLEEKHKRRLVASGELLHRLYLMTKGISYFWCGHRKDFKDPAFEAILLA